MMNAPATVPDTVPRPPVKDVPPTMAAVSPVISYPMAPLGSPALFLAMKIIPASPIRRPLIRYDLYMLFLTLIPLASAALLLPPIAYTPRPYLVLFMMYQMAAVIITTISTGTGMNEKIIFCPISTYLPSCRMFWPPVKYSAIPLATCCIPRVAMNAGTLNCATNTALNILQMTPTASAVISASIMLCVCLNTDTDRQPASASTDPTDRSMNPPTIRIISPYAMRSPTHS